MTDPLGLIPSLGHPETDRQVAIVGDTYQQTVDATALTTMQNSVGITVNNDYWNFQKALMDGNRNWMQLQRKYDKALASYVKAAAPLINSILNTTYNIYQLVSTSGGVTAAEGALTEAYNSLQPFLGSNTPEEEVLAQQVASASDALFLADMDAVAALQDVSSAGDFVSFVIFWIFK